MADRCTNPNFCLAQHEREVLAQDPPGNELGGDIDIFGESVMLLGTRASSECQVVAPDVPRNLLPNHHVRNETRRAGLLAPVPLEHFP